MVKNKGFSAGLGSSPDLPFQFSHLPKGDKTTAVSTSQGAYKKKTRDCETGS